MCCRIKAKAGGWESVYCGIKARAKGVFWEKNRS